jgi:hypothetical protein
MFVAKDNLLDECRYSFIAIQRIINVFLSWLHNKGARLQYFTKNSV